MADLGISAPDRGFADYTAAGGTMPGSIETVYITTFEQNVRFLAQQMESKLRDTIVSRSVNSQYHNWDRINKMEATQKNSVNTYTSTSPAETSYSPIQETPNQQAEWSRRTSTTQTWNIGTSIEQENPIQMLIDPQSALTREVAYGMRRKVDEIIIEAATGDALQSGNDGTLDAVSAFPAGQLVNNSTKKITFDMLTEVQEIFMKNTIDPNVPKVAVVGPSQVRTLMQLTQQTSSDYVDARALQTLNATGIVANWMGFTWIVSTLLDPVNRAGTAAEIDSCKCLFYTAEALGMQLNRDITVRIAEDPSISFAWRIYTYMTLGAVRVQDEQIVQLIVKGKAGI